MDSPAAPGHRTKIWPRYSWAWVTSWPCTSAGSLPLSALQICSPPQPTNQSASPFLPLLHFPTLYSLTTVVPNHSVPRILAGSQVTLFWMSHRTQSHCLSPHHYPGLEPRAAFSMMVLSGTRRGPGWFVPREQKVWEGTIFVLYQMASICF